MLISTYELDTNEGVKSLIIYSGFVKELVIKIGHIYDLQILIHDFVEGMIYPLTHSVLYIGHLRTKEPVREQTIKEETF